MPEPRCARLAFLFLFLCPLFVSVAADEPVVIEPGAKSVRPAKLPEHSATYVLFRGSGADRVALQEIRRELAHTRRGGKRALRLTWHTHAMGREVVDELVVDAKTLAPVFRSIPMPDGGVAEVEIDGKDLRASIRGGDGAEGERFERAYSVALHDASLPLLVALPKKEGARFRLATMPLDFAAEPGEEGAADSTDVRIVERATIAVEAGVELDAWVIEVTPRSLGVTTRLWLADEEPFVLRKEVAMPGMGEIVWELKSTE